MKKLFTFFALFCSLMLAVGCGSGSGSKSESKPESKSNSTEDYMNEKIQNVFFDTPFGASREELIRNFAKHGFDVNKKISTEDLVSFYPVDTTSYYRTSKKFYSFGGRSWKYLTVFINNGKFSVIKFQTSYNDKAAALGDFESLLSDISKKYNVSEAEPRDTTVYKVHFGSDKQNREVEVYCERGESVGGDLYYYVILRYEDLNISKEVSDEL